MPKLRMLCILISCLLLSASQASAQYAQSSLNVFLTFLLDPSVTLSVDNMLISERADGNANSEVCCQPIAINPGPPPIVPIQLASWTPRGGRGYARVRSWFMFANYSFEPASVTVLWTAAVFREAVADHRTLSMTRTLVMSSSWPDMSGQLSGFGPMNGIFSGQTTFFVPPGWLRRDGTIRPGLAVGDAYFLSGVYSITSAPEPVSMVLLGTGLLGVAAVRRRRRGTRDTE